MKADASNVALKCCYIVMSWRQINTLEEDTLKKVRKGNVLAGVLSVPRG